MPDTSALQPGQMVGGNRFALVRALGRGGMGEVWLAQDTRLNEPVALKFLPPEVRADPAALDELRRETARSHKLTHPNIIRIHDFHEPEGEPAFISMEYVEGWTLTAVRIEQASRVLSWEYLRPLAQQLCAALDYAHGEQVIHRDLKPGNIMVDTKGRLKLADFGIAATMSNSASRVLLRRATSGSVAYMSPQQLAGKRPSAADDIYAMGATLYELLTSKPPFFTGAIRHQVLHEPPEPLSQRLDGLGIQNPVPGEVAALITACLAKEPGHRPQSAAVVAGRLGLEVTAIPSLGGLANDVFSEPQEADSLRPFPSPGDVGTVQRGRNRSRILPGVVFSVLAALVVAARHGLLSPASKMSHGAPEPETNAASSIAPTGETAPPLIAGPGNLRSDTNESLPVSPVVPERTRAAAPAAARTDSNRINSSRERTTVIVRGKFNPWLAGMPDHSRASRNDRAPFQSPLLVSSVTVAGGRVFTFTATGMVGEGPGPNPNSPPGGRAAVTCGPENGIAKTRMPICALAGVFLGPDLPNVTPAPEMTDYGSPASRSFSTLKPRLKQVFFIGGGRNESGAVREFVAPPGATRLFLGTMDGYSWNNNSGFFTVEVSSR